MQDLSEAPTQAVLHVSFVLDGTPRMWGSEAQAEAVLATGWVAACPNRVCSTFMAASCSSATGLPSHLWAACTQHDLSETV